MKLILAVLIIASFNSFALDNTSMKRKFRCEGGHKVMEIYYDSEPNTSEGFVTVKDQKGDTNDRKGAKHLVHNVDLKTINNQNGLPCMTTVKFDLLKVETELSVNFCDKAHSMKEIQDGQVLVSELECIIQ